MQELCSRHGPPALRRTTTLSLISQQSKERSGHQTHRLSSLKPRGNERQNRKKEFEFHRQNRRRRQTLRCLPPRLGCRKELEFAICSAPARNRTRHSSDPMLASPLTLVPSQLAFSCVTCSLAHVDIAESDSAGPRGTTWPGNGVPLELSELPVLFVH